VFKSGRAGRETGHAVGCAQLHPVCRSAFLISQGSTQGERVWHALAPSVSRHENRSREKQVRTLWQDVRYGFRMPWSRVRLHGRLAVLSLGLGIGANTAIFSLLNAVLLKSLPVHNPHEAAGGQLGPGRNPSLSNYTGSGMRSISAGGQGRQLVPVCPRIATFAIAAPGSPRCLPSPSSLAATALTPARGRFTPTV